MTSEFESFSAQLLAQLPVGIAVWRLADRNECRSLSLIYANSAASKIMKRELGAFIGRPIFDVFPAANPERVSAYAEVARSRQARDFGEVVYGDGHVAKLTLSVHALPAPDDAVAIVFESSSVLRRSEARARELSRFLDSIIEHLPVMLFLKDAETLRFERFNRAGEELLGLSRGELLGKGDHDFFPREQADFFVAKDREVLSKRTLEDIPEEPINTPTGTRWLHTRKIPILGEKGDPRYLLGVSIDITDQKRAEEMLRASHHRLEQRVAERTAELERQIGERLRAEEALALTEEELRQSQRLEAIGRLAGGVAHDFNNILSVVLGYSESIMLQLRPEDPMRAEIQEIERAALKAATLTQQLLAFSRQQVLQPRILELNQIVRDMERMLPRLLGEDIQLCILTEPKLSPIRADPGQIDQVLMNLVVNARDAMPTGGRLTIETANVELDDDYVAEHPEAQAGAHVMLSVTDTGMGMDRPTLSRAFEPFFTTKVPGKGSGLGLSTAFGIVKQSGGSIIVDSEPGRGASFKVFFPVTHEPRGEEERESMTPPELRGSETLLIVEDDDQLRALVSTQLRGYGYRAIACRGSAEALAHAETESIDLLLTDVVMPEMGGADLAAAVVERSPRTRILFMSGYTNDAIVRHGVLDASVAFLQKPFRPDTLARRVREVLRPR